VQHSWRSRPRKVFVSNAWLTSFPYEQEIFSIPAVLFPARIFRDTGHESSVLSFAMLRQTSVRVAGILLAAASLTDASATLARRQAPADDAPSVWQYRGCWRYVDVCFHTLQ
jgi:hypothetical protein